MTRIIEAKAVISAEDRTGKAFDAIARKFKDVGKAAKVSAEVGKLAKQLDAAQAGLKNIDRFRSTQASFNQARAAYRGTQVEVARIAKELDAARKAASAFDGVKSFSKNGAMAAEMAAARKQVTELERQLTATQRAVKASANAYEAQAIAIKGAKREAEASGLSVGKLAAEQARLKAAVEGTSAAILKQASLERSGHSLTAGMGAAGRQQADRIAAGRRLAEGMGAPARAERAARAREEHEARQAELRRRASASGDLISGMGGVGRRTAEHIDQGRHLIDGMSAPARAAAARRQEEAEERQRVGIEQRQARRDAALALGGGAGVYLGHKVKEGTDATLHTYRDFDKYKRQTQAFGNFDDAEMGRIVDMAIHGGATTRYNDIQWLQGAKALGGRGVKSGSVMGILPEASQYGQAMSTDLPDAVAGLEGSLFAFKRDLSTPEKAAAAARRTADLQVGAAKAFGLTHHDLKGGYEYGALGAEMSGLGEEKLLAFLGLGKKLNIDGMTQGNAFNAMTAKFLSPTRKGREALAGVGIDYSKRQQMPERLSVDNFSNMIAQQYGVKLDKGAKAKLETGFTNKDVFSNASAFAIMVKDALKGQVGISNAKDANKVAGSAERFRQNNVEKVDVNGLLDDVLEAVKGGNLALANSIWGEKQGKRVMAALREGDVWRESVKKVQGTPEGKAKSVADAMNAGFDGAMARFEGSIKNIETAFGRAWDDDGKGGFLTSLADAAARATQSLAELPKPVLQAASGLAWVGGKAATASGTLALIGAAFSLNGSAAALTAAAVRLGIGGAAGAAGSAAAAGAGAVGAAGKMGRIARFGRAALPFIGTAGLGVAAIGAGVWFVDATLPNNNRMNGNGRGLRKAGGIETYPGSWGEEWHDVSGGVGATGGRYTTNREKTWGETLLGRSGRLGGPDPTRMDLPTFGFGAKGMPAAPLPETQGPQAPATVPLPPSRPPGLDGAPLSVRVLSLPTGTDIGGARDKLDPSGQARAINNTLDKAADNSATKANGGKPIEATVKPDQITARIDTLPPVSGEATVTVDNHHQITVTLNTDMLDAKVNAAAGKAVARIPLASSGARPGAVSMPGAASTPGAK